MKRNCIIPILLISASVGLTILSLLILPSSVIIQFSAGSSGNTVVPKFTSVLIPLLLGVGGAFANLFSKGNENVKGKGLLVSLTGIVLFVIMIVVNCIVIK